MRIYLGVFGFLIFFGALKTSVAQAVVDPCQRTLIKTFLDVAPRYDFAADADVSSVVPLSWDVQTLPAKRGWWQRSRRRVLILNLRVTAWVPEGASFGQVKRFSNEFQRYRGVPKGVALSFPVNRQGHDTVLKDVDLQMRFFLSSRQNLGRQTVWFKGSMAGDEPRWIPLEISVQKGLVTIH
jgi:hypothetical protein